jgi:hypothetical protein
LHFNTSFCVFSNNNYITIIVKSKCKNG